MTRAQHNRIRSEILGWFRPVPTITASAWAEQHLVIPPPQTQRPGPLSFAGVEYARELVDFFSDPWLTDETAVWGSQSGKSNALMAGLGYIVACAPSPILWVGPSRDLVGSFSKNRWQPIVRSSPELACLVPTGVKRHDYATFEQQLGGSVINFVGANSPGQLASRPARVVVLDETDKFPSNPKGEADAADLADQRTKAMASAKRVKTSTPTTTDGLVWQHFLLGDQRRYQVPCPHCGKAIILAWSKAFQTLPLVGCEAWIAWDREAKRADGSWDFDRVFNSARCECPHCQGHFTEGHKTRAVRSGVWVATSRCSANHRSHHLPSLYASGPETTLGALSVKFLREKGSLMGLQGFVNGALAEPWESQDTRAERTEIILRDAAPPLPGQPVRIMTVDCQQTSPHFYLIARDWTDGGHSRLVWAGTDETFEAIRDRQTGLGVADNRTVLDSGYDTMNVYSHCLRWGVTASAGHGVLPIHIGWAPAKGREGAATWKDKACTPRIFGIGWAAMTDPTRRLPLLEFSSDAALDVLATLRGGEVKASGIRWEVPADAGGEEYWRQLDAKHKRARYTKATGRVVHEWAKRSHHYPDHYLDCEIMQVIAAMVHGKLVWKVTEQNPTETHSD